MRGNDLTGMFISLIFFGSLALILWKYFEGNHKVKMALIEKGYKPEDNPLSIKTPLRGMNPLRSLQWGMLALFIGLGTLVGTIINNTIYMGMAEQVRNTPENWRSIMHRFDSLEGGTMFACITIFGGLGLVLFYYIAAKKNKEEQKKS
jgi:hypothetical protein